jgi:hypothetical protein
MVNFRCILRWMKSGSSQALTQIHSHFRGHELFTSAERRAAAPFGTLISREETLCRELASLMDVTILYGIDSR